MAAPKDDPSLPLSSPPSPFLSKELYLQCHRIALEQATLAKQRETLETAAILEKSKIEMEKLGSDISSSEDELLTGGDRIENHYSPIGGSPRKDDKDDDRMSLSSLSSGDQKIEVNEKPDETQLHYQPYQYPGYPGYYSQQYADWRGAYPYSTPLYLPQYAQFGQISQPYVPYMMPQTKEIASNKEDPHAPTINAVIEQVTTELKQILKKDFNKKMVENTAFKKFETWWDDEQNKDKMVAVEAGKPMLTKDNINVLLEANHESNLETIGMGSSFGLGLRASLPKMPSFRRKKMPSPAMDEDSRKASDQEEMVLDSDNESRTESRTQLRRVRKASVSSTSSSSSAFSSSSEVEASSSESESSSEDEPELAQARTRTPEGRTTPIPTDGGFTPTPMEDGEIVEDEPKPKESPKPAKAYESDEMSDGEREYLERRKRNTEYMEQIERERKLREPEAPKVVPKTVPKAEVKIEPKEEPKEVEYTERREAEREALLSLDRNPEPPQNGQQPNEYSAINALMQLAQKKDDSDEENLEARKKKRERAPNGAIELPKRLSESDVESSPLSQVAIEHSYCLPPVKEELVEEKPSPQLLEHDHVYTHQKPIEKPKPRPKKPKTNYKQLQEIQNVIQQRPPPIPTVKHKERDMMQECALLYEFLTKGIDKEDINYLRTSYEAMLADDTLGYWLNDTHWVDHCVTDLYSSPPKRRKRDDARVHASGCARTEGYYKLEAKEKAKYKYHHLKTQPVVIANPKTIQNKMQLLSREARSNQRRLLTAFGIDTDSDLLKFNQLKFRKKHLKFAKSAIHDWGLFAMEPIAADEMVIEYVGQMVRPVVADLRENKYEATGIGSSYLFRIDLDTIIDATKCGNLARFINHSCNVSPGGGRRRRGRNVKWFFIFVAAKLLRQSHHDRVAEEDRHLFEAEHRRERGDNVRLQVPAGGREDSVLVRRGAVPRHAQLKREKLFSVHRPTRKKQCNIYTKKKNN